MGNNNFLKLGAGVLWLAVSIASCYLTVESFYLLTGWSRWLLWIMASAFFLLSSVGMTFIYDSFNSNSDLLEAKRTPCFVTGLLIVLAFWGIFSLPTNAHTLYLQENAIEVVKKDLVKAQKELDNLPNKELTTIELEKKLNNVETLLSNLEVEYLNPSRRGLGWRCDTIIVRIERELSNKEENFKIDKSKGRTAKESFEHIARQVYNKLENSVKKDLTERLNISKEHQIQMKATSRKINNLLKHIDKMNPSTAVENSQKPLESACSLLETYTKKAEHEFDNTETAKLKNVYGVLFSWFRGDLKGQGFAIWFVISILIDLAGFLFATIAFRNTISKKIFN
ncbi:MAG: hypothetical protein UHE91_05215 [Bacteroidales bacterium]|nr:hypothetical protein [Bacteroidales bacterium]